MSIKRYLKIMVAGNASVVWEKLKGRVRLACQMLLKFMIKVVGKDVYASSYEKPKYGR